jgi:hypothetical protein
MTGAGRRARDPVTGSRVLADVPPVLFAELTHVRCVLKRRDLVDANVSKSLGTA